MATVHIAQTLFLANQSLLSLGYPLYPVSAVMCVIAYPLIDIKKHRTSNPIANGCINKLATTASDIQGLAY